jgi:hypothetical protein
VIHLEPERHVNACAKWLVHQNRLHLLVSHLIPFYGAGVAEGRQAEVLAA